MNEIEKPRHGDCRSWRIECDPGITEHFTDANGGQVTLSYSPGEQSVVERYCEGCGSWSEQHGICDAILKQCKTCDASYSEVPAKH